MEAMEMLESLDETSRYDRINTSTHLGLITHAKHPSIIVDGTLMTHAVADI